MRMTLRFVPIILMVATLVAPANGADSGQPLEGAVILGLKGRVSLSRAGSTAWDPAQTNLTLRGGDRLRSGEGSRATLRLLDATIVNLDELSTVRVESGSRSIVELLQGVLSFFHRDRPGDTEVRGGEAAAIVRGTEFVVSVQPETGMEITLLEGSVEVTNRHGAIMAGRGDVVTASAGAAPARLAGLGGTNRSSIQWSLYYPAPLDPGEIRLPERWGGALKLYQAGELWRALEQAPPEDPSPSDAELLFRAGLQLSVGNVPEMESLLRRITAGSQEARLAEALRTVVRAVQSRDGTGGSGDVGSNMLTTELMALSYGLQAEGRLRVALEAARRAVAKSPGFGFAHARLAELEFAMGRADLAAKSLEKAMAVSPHYAPAYTLSGFLHAARGRHAEARESFDRALALDSAVADAWLGRGLVRFHEGDREGGRVDLEAAAALEPNRSVLRSYLAKAFSEEKDDGRALAELERARELDSQDPTAWLYSALIRFRGYELGNAIHDLEESAARNRNRAVFRSEMLLDQDAA